MNRGLKSKKSVKTTKKSQANQAKITQKSSSDKTQTAQNPPGDKARTTKKNPSDKTDAPIPMNILEFHKQFPDERACQDYLFKTRWNGGFVCPKCGNRQYSFHSSRYLYQCKSCGYQASLTAGTIFHKTRTSLQKWFGAIFFMSIQKVGISALALKRILAIDTYRTIWTMCHKIRKAMSTEDQHPTMPVISGIPGISGIIAINNEFLGNSKRGRKGNDNNEMDSTHSDSYNAVNSIKILDGDNDLNSIIHPDDDKEPNSTINPDDDEGKTLLSLYMGLEYTEMKVMQTEIIEAVLPSIVSGDENSIKAHVKDNEKDSELRTYKFIENKINTNKINIKKNKIKNMIKNKKSDSYWVNILINNLRTNLHGTYHCIGNKHLQRFLDEYCYRFNRRNNEVEWFDFLLSACCKSKTITYNELTEQIL